MKYILINGNINKVLGFLHKADYYQKFEAKWADVLGMNSIHSVYLKLLVRQIGR
jgi:hypothetical protein